jgi:SAM-dependent methyltransferase
MSISELDRSGDSNLEQVDGAVARRPAPPADLYAAGTVAIDELMRYVGTTGIGFERGRALDFGCGIGHTAQALTRHFSRVDGIELSSSMVELAESYNQAGDRCRYHLHRMQHLGPFADDTFDVVFSDGALLHLRPDNQLRFITEFLRVLRPGGIAVFDVASRYTSPLNRLRWRVAPRAASRRRTFEGEPFCLRAAEVRLQVELVGARVAADRDLPAPAGAPVDRHQFVILK